MEYPFEEHIDIVNQTSPVYIEKVQSSGDGYIHWHDNLELMYFPEGNCTVLTDVRQISVNPGDLIVMMPGSVHGLIHSETTYIDVIVDQNFCKIFGFFANKGFIRKRVANDEIKFLFEKIINEMENKEDYTEASIRISVLSVLYILFKNYSSEETKNRIDTPKTNLVKMVIKYIREHFREDFSISDISEHCGYTKFYISRAFKEIIGISIVEYLNKLRINAAKELIIKGNMSMGEISAYCGFSNQSYFGMVFKKIMGFSPMEYKTKNNTATSK